MRNVVIFTIISALFIISCKKDKQEKTISYTLFYASVFTPVVEPIRKQLKEEKKITLRYEGSGSQVALRKVTELNRQADLILSADAALFKKIGNDHFLWRIEFAYDEIVLGVGKYAKYVDQVEKNWIPVLLKDDVSIGRVNENLGPIGYRTLLTWKLAEKFNQPGLLEILIEKTDKVVEHVSQLAMHLKSGDIEYAFIYKTTALKNDIRFIPLDESINLGSTNKNYSTAFVSFKKGNKTDKQITVHGKPIVYGLSAPKKTPLKQTVSFVSWLLNDKIKLFSTYGFTVRKPVFFGDKITYEHFRDFCEYGGAF